jgi:signal transduction histidine kinase
MENSTFKLNKSFVNISNIVQKAFNIVGHVADLKNVSLVEAEVLEEDAQYYNAVYGDENRILQVMVNFLSNSLKFSSSNSKVVLFLKMIEKQTIKMGQDSLN